MMVESFPISQRAKLTEWENGEIGYDATQFTFRVNVSIHILWDVPSKMLKKKVGLGGR